MLEFLDLNETSGTISIYDRSIMFNSKLLKYFENAYKVRVGLDKELNELYIFMINKDYALSGELSGKTLFDVKLAKSYARISSSALVDAICKSFNKEKPEGKDSIQLEARYNEGKNAIVVHMGGVAK